MHTQGNKTKWNRWKQLERRQCTRCKHCKGLFDISGVYNSYAVQRQPVQFLNFQVFNIHIMLQPFFHLRIGNSEIQSGLSCRAQGVGQSAFTALSRSSGVRRRRRPRRQQRNNGTSITGGHEGGGPQRWQQRSTGPSNFPALLTFRGGKTEEAPREAAA